MRTRLCIFVQLILCFLPVAGCTVQNESKLKETTVKVIDMSQYKASKPNQQMKLIFIHHSCGGQWLANRGEAKEIVPDTCLYESHPNGGGLKTLLHQNNYEVHEASYKSKIGDKTDVCDWNVKFRESMGEILRCDIQDKQYADISIKNDIVVFKSCFPNNAIESEGKEPGNPDSPIKTTANYKAAYTKLLTYFKANPDTLYICVTAPPLVGSSSGRLKELMKSIITPEKTTKAMGDRARRFNNWLKDSEQGWLTGYEGKNVFVFDYYDVLTKRGESNHALYPTNGGTDSHPSSEGNAIAAKEFVTFLNKAVDKFGQSKADTNSMRN